MIFFVLLTNSIDVFQRSALIGLNPLLWRQLILHKSSQYNISIYMYIMSSHTCGGGSKRSCQQLYLAPPNLHPTLQDGLAKEYYYFIISVIPTYYLDLNSHMMIQTCSIQVPSLQVL